MNQPTQLQAALDATAPILYVDLPSLMDGVASAASWLDLNGVRALINEALSLFLTPPTAFGLALCRPSSQLREGGYYVGSWQGNGQPTLGVLVVCPAGLLEEVEARQSDRLTVMAELLETDETARRLMARLRDPAAARLDANELAASLRAEFMARYHARLGARRGGSEPTQIRRTPE